MLTLRPEIHRKSFNAVFFFFLSNDHLFRLLPEKNWIDFNPFHKSLS